MASVDSQSSGDDLDDETQNLPQLFSDAARYEKFLAETKSSNSSAGNESKEASDIVAGFADLVGENLNSSEKAIAGRFAKLSVVGESWINDGLSSEPESYDSEDFGKDDMETEPSTPAASDHAVVEGEEEWRVSPPRVVDLMIQEFGPLTAEGEEEKLIIEADGALVCDVVVIVRQILFLLAAQDRDVEIPYQ